MTTRVHDLIEPTSDDFWLEWCALLEVTLEHLLDDLTQGRSPDVSADLARERMAAYERQRGERQRGLLARLGPS